MTNTTQNPARVALDWDRAASAVEVAIEEWPEHAGEPSPELLHAYRDARWNALYWSSLAEGNDRRAASRDADEAMADMTTALQWHDEHGDWPLWPTTPWTGRHAR